MSYRAHTIYHINLANDADISPHGGAAICYYWWNNIPLGHVWYTDSGMSDDELRKEVANVIRPAINWYGNEAGIDEPASDWEQHLRSGNQALLRNILAGYLDSGDIRNKKSIQGTISVVICTRNRAAFLDGCINALMSCDDQDFELIVVDNAPDDDSTRVVAEKYGARYVLEKRKGLDIARNTGALNARYPIVAYTDDDVIVEPGWIGKLKRCFDDPKIMAVTGQVFPVTLNTRSQYLFERYWGFNKGYIPTLYDHDYFAAHSAHGVPVWNIGAGANMAFRKEVFHYAGLFDERLDVGAAGCSGDSEYWYRILADGWNCYYCPQLYVYHNHRADDKAFKSQIFNYMRGHAAALLVQYENYEHQGNLHRLYDLLPRYYLQGLKNKLMGRQQAGTVLTEIRGCISGWNYYRNNKKQGTAVHTQMLRQRCGVDDNPLVSVVITCYNHGRFLAAAIESVLNQTYKHTEIIVVDDGSTDETAEVVQKYRQVISVRQENLGLSAARNSGIAKSTGNFIVFLDADDYLYPNALEVNLYFFNLYPFVFFISGGHYRVDVTGNVLPTAPAPRHMGDNYLRLLEGNYIGSEAAVMYKRELFDKLQFDTALDYCEDYEINLRIARQYPCFSHSEIICAYRIHEKNMSRNKQAMMEAVKKILATHLANAPRRAVREAIAKGTANWEHYYLHQE